MNFYHTYRWLAPSLLFSVLLILARVIWTVNITFLFLTWNLFLAALPLYFAFKLRSVSDRKYQWLYACLWLLFFPNAMYIVTDLFHLYERPGIPLWFDLLVLLSAALNGVIMGFVSLYTAERWLKEKVSHRYLPWLIFGLLLLCGYGIYLGRYLRWNSWDIVAQPFGLAADMLHHIIHPWRNREVWLLSLLFASWMYLLYRYLKRLKFPS